MSHRTTGFVLSGGGAKGSFSAGALDHLLRHHKIIPTVITGTSAGSICAAVLAQARSSAQFHTAATTLRDDIMRMSVKDASFVKQPWLGALDGTSAGDDIERIIRGKTRPPIPVDPTLTYDVLADTGPAPLTMRQGWDDLRSLITNLPTEHRALKKLGDDSRSIMLLDPLESALRGLSPGVGPAPIDQAAIAQPGLQLRLTITALADGCTRYVTETGHVVEQDAHTPTSGDPSPGVIEGVLASSSVPMVFPPRTIGADVYVDGGVLQNIPLAPALALGAEDIYMILADPLDCPPPQMDYRTANLFEVGIRAGNTVAFYDQQRRDASQPLADGTTLTTIDPTITAISTFETEPALLNINMDYGWLRACGQTAGLSSEHRRQAHHLADLITIGRLRSWYLDEGFGGSGQPRDDSLASAQNLVTDSLATWRSLGLATPPHADSWANSPGTPQPS